MPSLGGSESCGPNLRADGLNNGGEGVGQGQARQASFEFAEPQNGNEISGSISFVLNNAHDRANVGCRLFEKNARSKLIGSNAIVARSTESPPSRRNTRIPSGRRGRQN